MTFDIGAAKSNENFTTIPDGKYVCDITDATVKDTKTGGERIAVTFAIAEGEYKSRKIFTGFNIKNQSEKAVEISMSQLKSMVECIDGMEMKFETPYDFCNSVAGKRVGVKTKTTKDETYGDRTDVHYYYKPSAQASAPAESENIGF